MIRYSSDVSIARAPSDVFGALLDQDLYGQWTEMVDTRFDGPGEPQVGTEGRFRLPSGPMAGEYEMRISTLDRDRRLVIEIDHPKMAWISDVSLEPIDAGTRMTYAGEIRLRGWRRILEPVMGGEVRKGEAHEAERFKALLESETEVRP